MSVNPITNDSSDSSSLHSNSWDERDLATEHRDAFVASRPTKFQSIRSVESSRTACTGSARTDSTDCSTFTFPAHKSTNQSPPSGSSARHKRAIGSSVDLVAFPRPPLVSGRDRKSLPASNKMPRNRLKYCRLAHYVDLAWFQCLACVALLLFLNRLFELNKDIAYLKHVSNIWLPNISIPSDPPSSSASLSLSPNPTGSPSSSAPSSTGFGSTATTPMPSVTAQIDGIQKEIELAKAKSAHFHVENLRKDIDSLIGWLSSVSRSQVEPILATHSNHGLL
jgi:hypothetical protein